MKRHKLASHNIKSGDKSIFTEGFNYPTSRGVVILPTGSGKANMQQAIGRAKRPNTYTIIGTQHGGTVTRYVEAISAMEAGLQANRDEVEVIAVIIGQHSNEWAKVVA